MSERPRKVCYFVFSTNLHNFAQLYKFKMDQMGRIGSILMSLVLLAVSCSPVIQDDFSVPQGEVVIRLKQDHQTTATKTAEDLPEVGEFVVEVTETSSGRLFFRKKYSDAMDQALRLNQGEHRLFAYYGDPKGIGFNSCYYVADQLFNVEPYSVTDVDAVAKLANVKVAVNFGQGLAFDYNEYYAEVVAANRGKLVFTKKETRHGYAPVGELSLVLYVYVQDKWMCYKGEPVTCEGNDFVTFNVDTERYGEVAGIQVVVSNEAEEVVKEIKVPGEAAPQDAPTMTVAGFTDNKISTVEADPTKHKGLKADIVAMGGIQNCILNINSSLLSSKGVPSQVDLATADESTVKTLEGVGVKFMRDMVGKRLAYIDFSGLANYISANVSYKPEYEQSCADFNIEVTDMTGKTSTSETYTITVDKSQAEFSIDDYDIWATKLTGLTMTVTKGDPSKFVIKCVKASDMLYANVMTLEPQSVSGNKVKFNPLTGLNAGTGYKVWAVYNGNAYNKTPEFPFTTEAAQQIGNNSFESFTVNTFSGTHTTNWFDLWASGDSNPWWATNSSATLDKSNTAAYPNYKSFPTVNMTSKSPHSGSFCITVSSIAVADASSEWNLLNSWGDAQYGEVFVGKADNSGEHKGGHTEDGHAFTSRPTSMSYWYKLDAYESDPYYVEVQVLGSTGEVIGSAKRTDIGTTTSNWTQVTLPINYEITTKKAAKIYIVFKSSATGKVKSRKYTLPRYVTGEGTVTVHAGNVLWLDDVTLNY